MMVLCIWPAPSSPSTGCETGSKFIVFFEGLTKTKAPTWWSRGIADVDVFANEHHAFISQGKLKWPLQSVTPSGKDGLRVEEKKALLQCTSGNRSLEIEKSVFDSIYSGSYVGWLGKDRSVVASYWDGSGFSYQIAGFKDGNRKQEWKTDVWAAGRSSLGGNGFHHVELQENEGIVIIYGIESHGAYAEAFDIATGKASFRFCTCYWFNFSEAWWAKKK